MIGNTFGWPINGDPHFEIFSWMMGGSVGKRLTHCRQPLTTPARRYATDVFAREIITSRDFLAQVHAGLPAPAGLPALIVWGDGDPAFRSRERERWGSLLPHHTTVILNGAGHYLQSDAPAEFATAIGDWLRTQHTTDHPADHT